MCGVAGYITSSNVDKSVLKEMTKVLHHRGPDGSGHFYSSGVALGHTRLSIVDLSNAGHQPMSYMDRYVITYNGEVYNYTEIRQELEVLGYLFNSDTDTEVILAAFDKWGVECLSKFNGMWAFVIYDKKDKIFFISRDRFGIKPLYYYRESNDFVFASEIKSILVNPLVKNMPNELYLEQYLLKGPKEYYTETAFESIFRFPVSSYFLGSAEELNDDFKINQFWTFNSNLKEELFSEEKAKKYAETYYEILSDAVRLRLRADVRVGSALSGGLDSSSIVYLVNQYLKSLGKTELQETFSSVYKAEGTTDCDESEFIDLVAKSLNVNSHQIEPKVEDLPFKHKQVIYHMENPPEGTCMSAWHTFQLVKETGVKVTLDGQGADEQLAGYLDYVMTYLVSLKLLDFYKEFKYFIKIPGIKKRIILSGMMVHFKAIFGKKVLKKCIKRLKGLDFYTNLNEQLEESTKHNLVNLIHYADHTSMAHSIESRMPFMDYRLIEFLSSVPATYKMHNGWTKYIARLAFDGKLPDEIVWRKDKMGWPIPEKFWFLGPLKAWIEKKIPEEINLEEKINKHGVRFLIRKLNLKVFKELYFSRQETKTKNKHV
ncbi:asparagine synthase (glutamine-hydrolyzing) [Colwellia psychrerythraea]|uniref:asparagine synthase (glutamine-hydrolyzing) n=1 Tax=Colwellia psychrerythraea TaxID=28229 RepID=A0A099KUR2_COLPS|nr:asparagine synthase (glutamine-hydrolyzing) [Colwellia psychrerythraea]KGJ93587.1 asparagine synthase (glutamine-hydrolyzing) [Colwellia psychrerythraea]